MPSFEHHIVKRREEVRAAGLRDPRAVPGVPQMVPGGTWAALEDAPDVEVHVGQLASAPIRARRRMHPLVDTYRMLFLDFDPCDSGDGVWEDRALRIELADIDGPVGAALRAVALDAGLDALACWSCGRGVGYYGDDADGRAAIRWATCALVWHEGRDEPVNVLCEGCAPNTWMAPVAPETRLSADDPAIDGGPVEPRGFVGDWTQHDVARDGGPTGD